MGERLSQNVRHLKILYRYLIAAGVKSAAIVSCWPVQAAQFNCAAVAVIWAHSA